MKTIAVFCGGGIKGFAESKFCELINLKADLYAGTSIGGLIACARASHHSWGDIIALFQNNAKQIFPKHIGYKATLLFRNHRYSNKGLLRATQNFFGETRMTDLSPVCITALGIEKENYGPTYFSEISKVSVVDVCMRTSAAPSYFAPYQGYVDGGLFMNNPVIYAIMRAKNLWPQEEFHVINIGSGDDDVKYGPPRTGLSVVGDVISHSLNGSEMAARELMEKFGFDCVTKYDYHDFQFSEPVALDDTKAFDVMRKAAYDSYVRSSNEKL